VGWQLQNSGAGMLLLVSSLDPHQKHNETNWFVEFIACFVMEAVARVFPSVDTFALIL